MMLKLEEYEGDPRYHSSLGIIYALLGNKENAIRVKVPQVTSSSSARSHFNRALDKYMHEWGFDDDMKNNINISLEMIPFTREFYEAENIGWKGVHA